MLQRERCSVQSNRDQNTDVINNTEPSNQIVDRSTEPLGFALTVVFIVLMLVVTGYTYSYVSANVSFVPAVTLSWIVALTLSLIIYKLVRVFRC